MRSKTKKIVVIAVIVMAVALIGIFVGQWIVKEQRTRLENEFRDEVAPLESEQSDLELQKFALIDQYMAEAPCGANTSIIILNMSERVYTDIYPLIEHETRTHLSAILAISDKHMPGEEGKITQEQLDEMLAAGWSYAVYWAGTEKVDEVDTVILDDYLAMMSDKLSTLGLTMPDTVIFNDDVYSNDYDTVLEKYGVKFAVHAGKSAYPLVDKEIDADGEGKILHPGMVGWNENGYGRNFLVKIETETGVAAFAIDFDKEGKHGNYLNLEAGDYMAAFARMLDEIEESAATGSSTCLSFAEAYQNRIGYVNAWDNMVHFIGEQLDAIDARIEEIRLEIIEIMKKYKK